MTNNNKLLYLFVFFMVFSVVNFLRGSQCPPRNSNAVTYDLTAGRLGDHLMEYLNAKWISHVYKLPLLYQPFEYADQFVFSQLEPFTYADCAHNFTRVPLNQQEDLRKIKPTDTNKLYAVSRFANAFDLDWKKPGLNQIIKKIMQPIKHFPTIRLPKNKITIAIHVRKGSGKDNELVIAAQPRRFPPNSYYVGQIRKITQLFKGLPLYFHIFSDSSDTEKIVALYRRRIKSKNVSFGFSKSSQQPEDIIKDFLDLTKFQGIIRARSNFSKAASLVADFAVSVSPEHVTRRNNKVFINRVTTIINRKKVNELKKKFSKFMVNPEATTSS